MKTIHKIYNYDKKNKWYINGIKGLDKNLNKYK